MIARDAAGWRDLLAAARGWLAGLVLLAVAAACYTGVLRPAWQKYARAEQELERYQTLLRESQLSLSAARAGSRDWQQLKQAYGREFLDSRTPDGRSVATLGYFYRIQGWARDANVRLRGLNRVPEAAVTSAVEDELHLLEHRLVIRVAGSFDQIAGFLARQAAAPRVARVDSAVLTARDPARPASLEAEIQATLLFVGR